MQFDRTIERNLEAWRSNPRRKPLIVKGARQVGKTFALRTFAARHFRKVHYLNFELTPKARELFEFDLSPNRILREIGFLLSTEIDRQHDILILDELQIAPRGVTSLKYFNEELPGFAVCAAGSLIGLHLNDDSFPVGQVSILPMFPLTFQEFLRALDENLLADYLNALRDGEPNSDVADERLFTHLTNYFVVGGMPSIVATFKSHGSDPYRAFTAVRDEQRALIEAYGNDFAKHCGKVNALHIEQIFRAIPRQMASGTDSRGARFTVKNVVPGVAQFAPLASAFDWLIKAGLVLSVSLIKKPIPPLLSREQPSRFKAFLHDVGLLGAMAEIRPDLILSWSFSNFKGYFAENFVAQELRAAGVPRLFAWNEGTAEIEFVLDKGDYALPIEVKSGNFKQAKSLRTYLDRYNPKKLAILTGRARGEVSIPNVTILPMYRVNELTL